MAATDNASFASGLGDDVGPIEPGKRADLLVLNTSSYAHLPFDLDDDPIRAVVKDGWIVVDQGAGGLGSERAGRTSFPPVQKRQSVRQ
jgi:imidazolonepropionase